MLESGCTQLIPDKLGDLRTRTHMQLGQGNSSVTKRSIVHSLLALVAVASLASTSIAQCLRYGAWKNIGTLPVDFGPKGVGEEISGIVASKLQPDVLWTHDDKGNGPYLIAMRKSGKLVQHYLLIGASNLDWEDMAYGPGPEPGSRLHLPRRLW